MTALFLILCILSSGFTGNIYKKISDESQSLAVSALMPSLWFAILSFAFAVGAFITQSDWSTLLPIPAVFAGTCIFLAAFILIESMKKVALSISLIIINLNFVIPVILSAAFLGEHASWIQVGGILLSIAVIVFTNLSPSQSKDSMRGAILLPLVASLANGLVNFCIKINDTVGGAEFPFFTVMYMSAALCALLFWMFLRNCTKGKAKASIKKNVKKVFPYAFLMALCNGVCFYMTDLLASRMNAAAQFTVVTCASILLSLTVAFLFQGDRFTKKSLIASICCVIAVGCQLFSML